MLNRGYRQIAMWSLATVLGMTMLSTPANATLMVNIGGTLSGGTVTGGITYTDNQAGVDANPNIGVLDLGAFLDSVTINFKINGFVTASGSPVGVLAMTANATAEPTATFPQSITIAITDTGFTTPSAPLSLDQTTNMTSSVNGVTANAIAVGFYGPSNTEFDTSGGFTADATSTVSKGISLNAPGASAAIGSTTPYSLTTFITLTAQSKGTDPIQNLQLNSNLTALQGTQIPEPSTALFLGAGLVFAGLFFQKKKA